MEQGDTAIEPPARTSPEVVTRKSSVASCSEEGPFTVDRITHRVKCELYVRLKSLRLKCAIGMVYPPELNEVLHHVTIPQGYCRVSVDEVDEGFEDYELEY